MSQAKMKELKGVEDLLKKTWNRKSAEERERPLEASSCLSNGPIIKRKEVEEELWTNDHRLEK